jgi:ribosomal protein S27AE
MRRFHSWMLSSQVIERPTCPKCGNSMLLARIEPDKPDHDKRTFECFDCDHSESVVARYKRAAS